MGSIDVRLGLDQQAQRIDMAKTAGAEHRGGPVLEEATRRRGEGGGGGVEHAHVGHVVAAGHVW